MTPDLPAHQGKYPSAFASDDLEPLDPLHAQLDDIAGQGRWSYQLTVTGATFAPLIHVTADWQLLEYRGAGRPLRRILISGCAMGATVSDALQALVAQIRAAVAIEDAFDELYPAAFSVLAARILLLASRGGRGRPGRWCPGVVGRCTLALLLRSLGESRLASFCWLRVVAAAVQV